MKAGKIGIIILALIFAPVHVWGQQPIQYADGSSGNYGMELSVIKKAYRIILQNYFRPVEPDFLFGLALAGIQLQIGKDRLDFKKQGRVWIIRAGNKEVRLGKILEQPQGERAIEDVYNLIASANLQPDYEKITSTSISIMASLDRHSYYIPATEYSKPSDEEHTASVGIVIEEKDSFIKIVEAIESSPASKAGIIPGDRLSRIDERNTKGMKVREVIKLLRGKKGSEAEIEVEREGVLLPIVFRLKREEVNIQNVTSRLIDDGYGYIRIRRFDEKTTFELYHAIGKLHDELKKDLSGIILDLRNNPGGLFTEVLKVTQGFMGPGLIVSLEGRVKSRHEIRSYRRAAYGGPLVILVNTKTAAGPEILAGALQDSRSAVIVGTPTYKSDSIQTVFPFVNGAALKLTTSTWRLSRGLTTGKTGIVPDVIVEETPEDFQPDRDPCIERALQSLRQKHTDL